MASQKENLVTVLTDVGKPVESIDCPGGGSILVLPYGGRVLGLFGPENDQNLLWTNPALADPKSAAAFYADTDWHNSGGDRTWLSPEVEFFFPEYPDLDLNTYVPPRHLDPGNHNVISTQEGVTLGQELRMVGAVSKKEMQLAMTKKVGVVANPLRYVDANLMAGLSFVGFSLRVSLELLGESGDTSPVGLWNLLQLPHRGEMLIPTYSRTVPTVLFGDVPPADLKVSETMIRYRMRAEGNQKMAIPALATTGRLGYIYERDDASVLIVRNINVNPSAEYVDVPWDRLQGRGCGVQTCNINGQLGQFSEMEYHTPAIGGDTGLTSYDDCSQVWAFVGSHEKLGAIANILLSVRT
jgi:hypothetical protein